MHELTLAHSIVEMASAEALSAHAGSVREIELEIGVLSGVDPEALLFALSLAVRDTILENSAVKVLSPPGAGRCLKCDRTFEMTEIWIPCPDCSLPAGQILRGKELRIVSLVVDD